MSRDTMLAVVWRGPDRLAAERVPLPRLEPGDLLLRVRAASVCSTDLKILAHGHFKIPAGTSRVLGHELAGQVEQFAPDGRPAAPLAPGVRVGVAPNLGCGRCDACADGLDHLCPDYEALGITLDGGLAEFVRIPARAVARGHVIPLPDGVADDQAALVEPAACVLNAHEAAGTGPGDRVLILGAGPMGLLHVLIARLAGAAAVVVADPWPERRGRAADLGADLAVAPAELEAAARRVTGGRGFDVVMVTAPRPEAQAQAVGLAAVRGRVQFFAGLPRHSPPPALDTNAIHYRQLVVSGTTGASVRQYRRTLELVAAGRLRLDGLISRRAPLTDAAAVFEELKARKLVKAVFQPDSTEEAEERCTRR